MAYSKTDWTNNTSPYINATNLDKIETGIDEAHDAIDNTSTGHDHDGTDSKKVTATNVVNVAAGDIVATDVQAAINELDTEKVGPATTDTLTNKTFDADGTGNSITNIENADIKAAAAIAESKLTFADTGGHVHDGTASATGGTKIDASDVVNTPAGSIASTEVQAALNELDTEKLAKASNLSDVNNAATAFGNIKQAATESATGVLEKATTAECVTGTDTDRTVTPAGLTARMGAPGEIGGTTPAAGNFTTGEFSDDIDQGGSYMLNSASVNALNAKGAGYWFDGTDDVIDAGSSSNLKCDDGTWIILFSLPEDPTSTDGIAGMETGGLNNGDVAYIWDNNKLRFVLDNGSTEQFVTTDDLVIDTIYHIASLFGSNGMNMYLDGMLLTSTNAYTGGNSATSQSLAIGSRRTSSLYSKCTIYQFLMFNLNLTATEIKSLSSGAPIPFKYIGANQTLIVPSDDCADDDTANWTDVNGALTFDTDHYVYTVTTGASTASFTDEAALTVGKRYRATVLVKDGTGAGSTVRINALTNADAVIENGASITVDGTYAIAVVEWIATETNNKVKVEIVAGSVSDGETVFFDEITTNQIGCVLQLEQDGTGHNQWLDKSGNENHGAVTGALPINLPVDHQEKYIDLAVTDDTNFTLPKGYLISSIVLTSDGTIGGGIDIGTTDGGGEIVTAQAIAGAGTVLCALVAGANYNTTGADDIIYITDADGTGWDGASVIVRVQMQRVEL